MVGALAQAQTLFPFSRTIRNGPSAAAYVAVLGLPPDLSEHLFQQRLAFDPHSADILLSWANLKSTIGQRDAGVVLALAAKKLIPSIKLLEQPRVPPTGAAPEPSGGKETSK